MPRASLISVVDDDLFFRESMKRLMRSLDHKVEVFASAADLLASPYLLETGCLIADVQMPTTSGLELRQRLTERGHAIPTIFVTAYPNDIDRTRARSLGAVCYLSKPIDEGPLVECIRAALGLEQGS